jgi:tripartite-type tricarboxylate transporter receptor subunit TctC
MKRRSLIACAFGGIPALILAESAFASDFPAVGKPIRIVTLIAGGAPDIFSRLIGKELTERLGVPVVVENKAGAGGNIAAELVVRSPPDGHTLLMSSPILAIGPYEMAAKYDPLKDLQPIAQVAETEFVILVGKSMKVASLQELVQAARQTPGKLNFAANLGSPVYYATMEFQQKTGTKLTAIPFKGSSEGQLALARGDVDIMIDVMPSSLPNLRGGRATPLAVASDRRSKHLPDVPTAKEQGIDFVAGSWNGIFAPAGTPPAVVEKLSSAIEQAMKRPELVASIEAAAAIARYRNPRELGTLLQLNATTYNAIRQAGDPGAPVSR